MAGVKSEQWNDPGFQDELIKYLVFDPKFLQDAGHLFSMEDFRAEKNEGMERPTVAKLALEFYQHYHEPVGKLLRSEMLDYLQLSRDNEGVRKRLLEYAEAIQTDGKRTAADSIMAKVKKYKIQHHITKAMSDMTILVGNGTMTPEKFMEIARTAVDGIGYSPGLVSDIFSDDEFENRLLRRSLQTRRHRFPVLLIDPLDRLIRVVARKHLGLALAPYKRGKTLFFVWLALAYTLQGYNVLFYTLEDPKEDIEDRFDAAITSLPISRLAEMSDEVRVRYLRYKRLIRTKLKVVDGTDGGTTIGAIDSKWAELRNNGFTADVIIIDYDDEIRPQKKQQERRMEFGDIYRDLRAMLARNHCIGWTASQTSRSSEDMKIISGKHIAEDISKIRKCAFALSLGKGDWGPDSIFLWVAAHRYDRMEVGCNIMTNKQKSLFFDRDMTVKKEKEDKLKAAVKAATTPQSVTP